MDTPQHVPNHDREKLKIVLLICRSSLNWQTDVDLMQQLREKAGLLEAQWLHAAAKSQQAWLEDFSLHFLELLCKNLLGASISKEAYQEM